MVYLIGVDHCLQFGCCDRFTDVHRKSYEAYLVEIIKSYSIEIVAEEMSEHTKINYCEGFVSSIAQDILEQDIEHVMIDPTGKERGELGIESRDEIAEAYDFAMPYTNEQETVINLAAIPSDRKREGYWFERIFPYLDKNVLVLCGYCHEKSFSDLLRNHSIHFMWLKNFSQKRFL